VRAAHRDARHRHAAAAVTILSPQPGVQGSRLMSEPRAVRITALTKSAAQWTAAHNTKRTDRCSGASMTLGSRTRVRRARKCGSVPR
jgi:hypothetical protein